MAQNKQPIEDLRVRRTRKLITQALIELTIEKGFAALTVQDIADRAMVNRATFYRHYLDKHDLLDKYMQEVHELTADQERLRWAFAECLSREPAPEEMAVLAHCLETERARYASDTDAAAKLLDILDGQGGPAGVA